MESNSFDLTSDFMTTTQLPATVSKDLTEWQFNAVLYLSALKITIGTVGIIGNLVAFIVLSKIESHKVKFLLSSQAMIDLLTSVILIGDAFTKLFPPVIPQNPVVGYVYCLFWRYEMVLFVFFALSTYNLVAISIERYILVTNPLYYQGYFTRNKQLILAVTSWLLAPVMQLTYAVTQETWENGTCRFIPLPILDLMGVFLFVWDFFIPCLIMGFCFVRICFSLYQQDKEAKWLKGHSTEVSTVSTGKIDDQPEGSSGSTYAPGTAESTDEYRRSRSVTKTFLVIFIVYVVCWVTNQFLFLQQNLGGYNHHGTPENHFANSMVILNSACNPFIYVLHMKQYRDKFKSYFMCGR